MSDSIDVTDAAPVPKPAPDESSPYESEETFALPTVVNGEPVVPEALPSDRFLDRELSWLAFNERVLELAPDPNAPEIRQLR